MPAAKIDHAAAARHFRKADPVIARVIKQVGPCTLKPQRDRFNMLVRSIISQQISTAAARSIRAKLEALIAPEKVSPEVLARFTLEQLKSAGLSSQKATYLHDLAGKTADGTVRLKTIGKMEDEEAIEELIQVKGIGRWTAQMFLIFSLGRPDVFPPDDLGIKMALRNLYGLTDLPSKSEAHALAAPWTPHSTFATWYLWRSLDLAKAAK
ncbi:MAG: DNA-3-methyladenine glycosylase family protein [Pirellulaceae bacterium]